jgi:FMNH2-dependent dimethyl sulfone monooxygenase
VGADLVLLQFSPQLEEMERFAEQVIPIVRGTSVATKAPSAARGYSAIVTATSSQAY